MQPGTIEFSVETGTGRNPLTFETEQLVCCGWTARDRAAAERHIDELARLGVPRPTTIPIYIRLPRGLITTTDVIEVGSATTSGEVECVLLYDGTRRWLTVGSDHTDRHIEAVSVVASKQMCGKYIAPVCWTYDEVQSHCDRLRLRSWVGRNGTTAIYQDGSVASLLPPHDLLDRALAGSTPSAGVALFAGTIPTISDIVYGDGYDLELHDPVLNRTIRGSYRVEVLPQRV
jgi:Protein of unknown function (DUF2848)